MSLPYREKELGMTTSVSRTIKSAARVLEILEFFDQDRQHATVMDMSRTLSYPQSSTSELLRCLTRLGFLRYNRYRRTYSPTTRVALLGAWVNPSLFRGGPMLSAIDNLARETGETVVLSTAANYEVQHIHVIHGEHEAAADVHVGDLASLLHSPQGRMLLSSYRSEHVRLALHRLNAEEADAERRVQIAERIGELAELRMKGWMREERGEGGWGCVCALLPPRAGMDRLAMSVIAQPEVIAERGEELTVILLRYRDEIANLESDLHPKDCMRDNVVPMHEPIKIPSYHRNFM